MATVLIVDDAEVDRELTGRVVTSAGHVAAYAMDGEDGVAKAKAIKPALILMDVVMPRQDGFATCRKLKKDADTAAIPVVLITSKGQDSDKFWGERQGCDAYVVKPFTAADLTNVIKRFLP